MYPPLPDTLYEILMWLGLLWGVYDKDEAPLLPPPSPIPLLNLCFRVCMCMLVCLCVCRSRLGLSFVY